MNNFETILIVSLAITLTLLYISKFKRAELAKELKETKQELQVYKRGLCQLAIDFKYFRPRNLTAYSTPLFRPLDNYFGLTSLPAIDNFNAELVKLSKKIKSELTPISIKENSLKARTRIEHVDLTRKPKSKHTKQYTGAYSKRPKHKNKKQYSTGNLTTDTKNIPHYMASPSYASIYASQRNDTSSSSCSSSSYSSDSSCG